MFVSAFDSRKASQARLVNASCCWVTSAPARVYLVDAPTKFDQAAESTQTFNISYVGAAGE